MKIIIKYYLIIFILIGYSCCFNYSFAQRKSNVGIDEQLGKVLPLELKFVTSNNDTVRLKDIIDKPVLLALVYYECPGICSPMQNEVAWVIDQLDLVPGADYKVISLSFDYRENYQTAAKWKKNYLHSMKKKLNEYDWIFLTGDSINVYQLTDAVGFYFEKNKEGQIIHPSVLISIAPDGKIVRYILGPTFNPFDIKMALIEAKSGRTSPTVAKVLELCYSYDPEGKKYTFNFLRVVGIIMLFIIGIFISILLFRSKKKNLET